MSTCRCKSPRRATSKGSTPRRGADGALYLGKARGKGMAVAYRPELVAEITGRSHVL
jgi:hypothetical protein